MTSTADVWELRLGVYATPDELNSLRTAAERLLAERFPRWTIDTTATARDDEAYEELPEQWRAEHPGQDGTGRAVHELRAGVLAASGQQARDALDALTRILCPDPDHAGPCPVPWSSSGVTGPADGQLPA